MNKMNLDFMLVNFIILLMCTMFVQCSNKQQPAEMQQDMMLLGQIEAIQVTNPSKDDSMHFVTVYSSLILKNVNAKRKLAPSIVFLVNDEPIDSVIIDTGKPLDSAMLDNSNGWEACGEGECGTLPCDSYGKFKCLKTANGCVCVGPPYVSGFSITLSQGDKVGIVLGGTGTESTDFNHAMDVVTIRYTGESLTAVSSFGDGEFQRIPEPN